MAAEKGAAEQSRPLVVQELNQVVAKCGWLDAVYCYELASYIMNRIKCNQNVGYFSYYSDQMTISCVQSIIC